MHARLNIIHQSTPIDNFHTYEHGHEFRFYDACLQLLSFGRRRGRSIGKRSIAFFLKLITSRLAHSNKATISPIWFRWALKTFMLFSLPMMAGMVWKRLSSRIRWFRVEDSCAKLSGRFESWFFDKSNFFRKWFSFCGGLIIWICSWREDCALRREKCLKTTMRQWLTSKLRKMPPKVRGRLFKSNLMSVNDKRLLPIKLKLIGNSVSGNNEDFDFEGSCERLMVHDFTSGIISKGRGSAMYEEKDWIPWIFEVGKIDSPFVGLRRA